MNPAANTYPNRKEWIKVIESNTTGSFFIVQGTIAKDESKNRNSSRVS